MAAIWISIGLVAIGGLLWGIHAVRQQMFRDRAIALQTQKTKEEADATCAKVVEFADTVAELVQPALKQAGEIHRIKVTVIGEDAPASRSGKSSTPGTTTTPRRTDTDRPSSARSDDGNDRDRPESLMSREARLAQIEAERRRHEARKKETTVGGTGGSDDTRPSAPAGGSSDSSFARRTGPRQEPRIQALARKTKNLSEAIERKGLTAEGMVQSAHRLNGLIKEQNLPHKVQKRATELNGIFQEIQKLEEDAKDEMEQITTYLAEAQDIEKAHHEELARIEAAKEEARRKAEHAALVKREIARAGETHRFNLELIEKNEFSEALRSVNDAMARFQTEEGRAKLALLKDKYERLVGLKDFLIERLTKYPMSFGWIQDGPKVDVLGADESGVKTRGKLTPWSDVSLPQITRFIDFYLKDEKIPVSQRADQGFAVALYFHELGKPEVADVYLERATMLRPALQSDATRLLGQ